MKSFTTILLVLFLLNSRAQEKTISGIVTDTTGKPLPYAELLLRYTSDSLFYKGQVSNDDGTFQFTGLENGTYFLEIRSLGYSVKIIHDLEISKERLNLELGTISLSETSSELNTVSVIAEKPFMERHPDKMVINIENSIIQSGSSIMEVMEKLPGVQVDQSGNIRVNGKQGVVVLFDGKPSGLSGQDLANMLRGMPSDQIMKIEIITNPSAKYDASGNAGIINIITKKNQKMGYNGSINLGYGQGRYGKSTGSFTFNYRKNKINLFSSYSYSNRDGYVNLILDRRFYNNDSLETLFSTDNYIKLNFITHVPKIGIDYAISDKTKISFLGTAVTNSFTDNTSTNTSVSDQFNTKTGAYDFTNSAVTNYYNYDGNLQLKHELDTSGQEIVFNFDYGSYGSDADQNFNTKFHDYINSQTFVSDQLGIQKGRLFLISGKADYTKTFRKELLFEAGLKSSLVGSDRDMQFYDRESSSMEFDSARSSHFIYQETIHAAYINFKKQLKKLSIQSGLRIENTIAEGEQKLNQSKFKRNYTQLFPTVYLNYNASKDHSYNLNLGRRIERPGYSMLNPFQQLIDATTYSEGNPYLLPALTYAVEFSYSYKNKLFFTVNADLTSDNITEVLTQNSETRVTIQRPMNLDEYRYYSMNISYSSKMTNWWRMNASVLTYYGKYTGVLDDYQLDQGSPSFLFTMSNMFPVSEGLSFELNIRYYHKMLYGVTWMGTTYNVSAGVQKSIMKKQGTLTLNCTDLFFRAWPSGVTTFGNVSEEWHSIRDTRVVNLNFTWKFGKGETGRMRRETGAEDEKRRM